MGSIYQEVSASPEFVIKYIGIPQPMEGQEEEGCRTPTTKESKLPSAPSSCPPAPKKPARVLSCKRRLQWSHTDHLVVVSAKEMEEMFQHVAKKRRKSLQSTSGK